MDQPYYFADLLGSQLLPLYMAIGLLLLILSVISLIMFLSKSTRPKWSGFTLGKLFHFSLSNSNTDAEGYRQLGRGRLEDRFPPEKESGVRIHRTHASNADLYDDIFEWQPPHNGSNGTDQK